MGRNQVVPLGRVNSLAWHTLLITAPGVADLYQGSELWNLTLVDPDNRRPVDYELRRRLLEEIRDASATDVMARADEGAPKLWLIARLLSARALHPEAFDASSYAPLSVDGAKSRHALAFARGRLAVIVPLLVAGLGGAWGDTTVALPRGRWQDALTGAVWEGGRAVEVGSLLGAFPVAVLIS
jgi:(1->4)-alpha-D-glucan 1-alpha-D-glucosylmutase